MGLLHIHVGDGHIRSPGRRRRRFVLATYLIAACTLASPSASIGGQLTAGERIVGERIVGPRREPAP